MYYITVEFHDGEIFKYLTDTEREANFFKTLDDICGYAIKQINIKKLFKREE